jgi:hypothetical protein
MIKNFFVLLLPAVRVHSWGGFGSQLFAMIIAERIESKMRFRKVKILFHTSGVTERKMEIPEIWLNKFTVEIRQDFSVQLRKNPQIDPKSTRSILRGKIKEILLWGGFVATCNSEIESCTLKPWVFSIRGHYTELNLQQSEILELMRKLGLSIKDSSSKEVAIHYRLGDLLELENKTFIEPRRIIDTLDTSINRDLPIRVFSDATKDIFDGIWRHADGTAVYEFMNTTPVNTVQSCFNAKEFLGTNAKLSLWIAIFRSMSAQKSSYIPHEINHQIECLLHQQESPKAILVY